VPALGFGDSAFRGVTSWNMTDPEPSCLREIPPPSLLPPGRAGADWR